MTPSVLAGLCARFIFALVSSGELGVRALGTTIFWATHAQLEFLWARTWQAPAEGVS